ncbi:hypothetical protein BV25DRAFT_1913917 [Artomyces pyxidatus]|uniref:Uncharacterized protein n=1 Tax=Artomyces pyxidatus TaxID=48021 RepID=A0ACB8TAJ8_9AGAM|nr:hypothetical protein BV25DRAFT_1913917 [Artomyces pyxidatus]
MPPLQSIPPIMLSSRRSEPRTPSLGSPAQTPFFLPSNNRKSSDSWNSSNAEDLEWEWKPDQILLLSRTLDALPAHLLTPFNGPVPPSNLLDKIARGVSQAKGAVEWPHSLRATRSKLVELARSRDAIPEEEPQREALQHTTNVKRPLYRQSSMDFMQGAKLEDRTRLARNTTYHPYARHDSPSFYAQALNPSTPSSTTLHSGRSHTRDQPKTNSSSSRSSLRRSTSTLSSTSSSLSLPRVPVRRTDSLPIPTRRPDVSPPLKRPPAAPTYASSDEEEQIRTTKAKKARRAPATSPSPGASPAKPSRPRMNVQRNPSILGGELPHAQLISTPPTPHTHLPPSYNLPPAHLRVQIPTFGATTQYQHPPRTPRSPRLRRVRPAVFPTRPARRISFNSLGDGDVLLEPVEIIPGEGLGLGLESAFQLR